jgi:acyl carrier protein
MEDLRERVSRVIADQFHVGPERITESATIDDDLAATSLDRVEVVMALEDEFAINIHDDEAAELRTVGDVFARVAANLRRRPAGLDNDGVSRPL